MNDGNSERIVRSIYRDINMKIGTRRGDIYFRYVNLPKCVFLYNQLRH